MSADWTILHGGALGDLVLTIQLALRLLRLGENGRLHLVARCNPGDLSACRPRLSRQPTEGMGLHWLHTADHDPPPKPLHDAVHGARVLNALGGVDALVHQRLEALAPAALFSFDPRTRPGLQRHITQQWQTDLEAQGLLVPKCIHQRPTQRTLAVTDSLRHRGRAVLESVGSAAGDVLIHPGSGGRRKCWPLANFHAVARQLVQHGLGACFLLGPTELEWWSAADLAGVERESPVLRLPSPDALAAALTAVSALVANDSGPAHLAALLGTPTVTLFGPTAAPLWRPLGSDAHVFAGDPASHPADWGIDAQQVATHVAARAAPR